MRMSVRSVPFMSSMRKASVPVDFFPPEYITANLVARWAADPLDSTYADGASVTSWSTTHGTPTAFTNGAKTAPAYKRGGANNHSYVNFSTTAMGLLSGTVTVGSNFSILIVATAETLLGGAQRTLQGNLNWLYGPYSNTWAVYNGSVFSSPTLAATAGQVVSAMIVRQAVDTFLWMNGLYYGSRAGSGGFGTALGLSGAGAFNEPWIGRVYEIIVYNINDFILAGQVHAWLNTKYGVV